MENFKKFSLYDETSSITSINTTLINMENKTEEQIILSKWVDVEDFKLDYPIAYGFIIEAMQEFGEQERINGIKEGFEAAREKTTDYNQLPHEKGIMGATYVEIVDKYPTIEDYLKTKG